MQLKRPVLLYSNYCRNCSNYLTLLQNNPDLFEHFIRICIDVDNVSRKRPNVYYELQNYLNYKFENVPTIIINNGNNILSGSNAFKWLENISQDNFSQDNISQDNISINDMGFNLNEMGRFSDSYADLSASSVLSEQQQYATQQTFMKCGENFCIQTPQENGESMIDLKQKEQDRKQLDNMLKQQNQQGPRPILDKQMQNNNSLNDRDLNKLMNDRNTLTSQNRNQNHNQNMNNKFNIQSSQKKNDLDNAFNTILNNRDNIQPKNKQPKNVDFCTGEVFY